MTSMETAAVSVNLRFPTWHKLKVYDTVRKSEVIYSDAS